MRQSFVVTAVLLALIVATPALAARHIDIRNCTDAVASVCVYDSGDIIDAVPASTDDWMEPGHTNNFHCATKKCQIHSASEGDDCGDYYWDLGKHDRGQYSIVWKEVKSGGKTIKIHTLVDGYQCE